MGLNRPAPARRDADEGVSDVQVELDIFSGRPNPRWRLNREAATLEALHASLAKSTARAPDPPGLGYRGFHYVLGGARWTAFGGVIEGPKLRLADPDRSVERFLADSLPAEYRALAARVTEQPT